MYEKEGPGGPVPISLRSEYGHSNSFHSVSTNENALSSYVICAGCIQRCNYLGPAQSLKYLFPFIKSPTSE